MPFSCSKLNRFKKFKNLTVNTINLLFNGIFFKPEIEMIPKMILGFGTSGF